VIDLDADALYEPHGPGQRYIVDFDDEDFGGAVIESADFDGDTVLIFDELGGPVATLDGDAPSAGGAVRVSGSGFTFEVSVEAYTGRVTVTKVSGG
jgi:hypothetical protein